MSNLGLYQDIFSVLCCLISSQPSAADNVLTVAPACEEIKLETVRCLTKLICAASQTVLTQFYCADSVPLLGHAVTILLTLARQESMRTLRLAAIECLVKITCSDCPEPLQACGDIFAAFLPGIASALTAVITGDSKQGHAVTCAAVSAWYRLICLVLSDSSLELTTSFQEETDSLTPCNGKNSSFGNSSKYANLIIKRTKDWVKSTSDKLRILMERITAVATDSHWKVRLAMVEMADSILTNCTRLVIHYCLPNYCSVEQGFIYFIFMLFRLAAIECLECNKAVTN
jgi:hypothetical protein